MEEIVLDVLKRALEDNEIDKTCSQKTCAAWDSMKHLNIVIELEMETGLEFTPEEITQMVSFGEIVRVVSEKTRQNG